MLEKSVNNMLCLTNKKSSWLCFLLFGFIFSVVRRNVNSQRTVFLPVSCHRSFVIVVFQMIVQLCYIYTYIFFRGHLDISWKLVEFYHLVFISVSVI